MKYEMEHATRSSASYYEGTVHHLIVGALLVGAAIAVHAQVTQSEFLLWDDPVNVVDNALVHNGLTVNGPLAAFKQVMITHWQPLTTISHMMDVSLYGMNPTGHHLANLILHIFNALLLFMVLHSTTGVTWRSAFVDALFALHPLHVEPVVWVSGRRDVLSTLFGLVAVAAYVSYARRGGVGRYALVGLFCALALLAKSMLVTLPLIFLLLDYWPLCRVRVGRQDNLPVGGDTAVVCPLQSTRRVVLEKVPLLLLSAVIGLVALLMLRGARQTKLVGKVPFPLRAAHAVVSYVSYIEKMIWPSELSPHYVHPNLPGGNPANFLDVGGSSNPQKTLAALQILLRNRQLKAILVNIFGGITRCDDIAQGILMAREQLNVAMPMVIRLIGTNEEKGRDMLQKAGMLVARRMTDAIQAAVRRARGGLQP